MKGYNNRVGRSDLSVDGVVLVIAVVFRYLGFGGRERSAYVLGEHCAVGILIESPETRDGGKEG